MPEEIERGILLTFDEIRILLYGMKVTEIEGVCMPEKIFREEEVIRALHHLETSGFIETESDRFLIKQELRQILEIMARPVKTAVWRPGGEEGPAFFLYEKEGRTVVSEQFRHKREMLKLTLFDRASFEKWREELTDDYCRD